MTAATAKHECPNSQEPRIGGNSGNGGNNQKSRGLQPFPPYKKSGNKWEHTPTFQYKSTALLCLLIITVPTKKRVGTNWERSTPLETLGVPTVPTVPTVFELTGTCSCEKTGLGGAMSPTCQYLSQSQRKWKTRINPVSWSKDSTLCAKLSGGSK